MIYEVTDENFEQEVVNSAVPCVIEFTAGWCTWCDVMVPTFESLAEEFGDSLKFCIVNTDEQRSIAGTQETTGGCELGYAKALAHQMGNETGRVFILYNSDDQLHRDSSFIS